MIKLFVFISLLTISINLQSQRIELLGTWTLSKHYVFDTTLKKDTNIFNGQISREITFHEGGILVLTTDNGEQFFGKWKLSKSRRKFSIDSDLRDFGFVSTKSSKHEFRNNELKIPFERLKPLYWTVFM
jgi:hypothetical protein